MLIILLGGVFSFDFYVLSCVCVLVTMVAVLLCCLIERFLIFFVCFSLLFNTNNLFVLNCIGSWRT
jgi:hypothetical protein